MLPRSHSIIMQVATNQKDTYGVRIRSYERATNQKDTYGVRIRSCESSMTYKNLNERRNTARETQSPSSLSSKRHHEDDNQQCIFQQASDWT